MGLTLVAGRVVTPGRVLDGGHVEILDSRIASVGPGPPPTHAGPVVRLEGRVVAPGFVDLHVHGGGGHATNTADAGEVAEVAAFHRRHGTTRMLAGIVTAPIDEMRAAASAAADVAAASDGRLVGCFLEGPFLAAARCGAQDSRYFLPPDEDTLRALLDAGRGAVRMVTVAPELSGALGLVEMIRAAGAVAAVGHSEADYRTACAAVDAGATAATHVFNAMGPMHHREPGVAGAALDRPQVVCELVADLAHVHPAVVRLVFRAKGAGGVALVTDAIPATGLPDGGHRLGGRSVTVLDGVVTTDDGCLAGSTLTLAEAVRRSVGVGVPLLDAVTAASATPARLVGIGDRAGSLEAGKVADLVVLDADLRVEAVLVDGEPVGAPPPWWPA